MKTLNVTFTDDEYLRLKKAKDLRKIPNWHNFLIQTCCKGISNKKNLSHSKEKQKGGF